LKCEAHDNPVVTVEVESERSSTTSPPLEVGFCQYLYNDPLLNQRTLPPARYCHTIARTSNLFIAMLSDANLPESLWAEDFKTATYLKDRSLTKALGIAW
jgi:hypothetical protein